MIGSLLGRLGATAASKWRRSLAVTAIVVLGLGVAARASGGELRDDFSAPGSESQAAADLLEQRFPAEAGDTATVVFSVDRGRLDEPARRAAIEDALDEIRSAPHVTGVASPLSRQDQISSDGRIAYATVQYDRPANELDGETGEQLAEAAATAERHGIDVDRRGTVVDRAEQRSAPVGELVGVALALVVLTIVLRSALAMALALACAAIAIVAGMQLLGLTSAFVQLPEVAPTLGLMLGLGAGIDYALLHLGRHREQLAAGDPALRAAGTANATAGSTVLTAGAIVVLAIAGLLVTGIPMVAGMGIGSAIIVAAVAVGAVTVLPGMLGMVGRRLAPGAGAPGPSARSRRWDERIVQRPGLSAGLALLLLLALALPATSLRLGQPDDGNDPAGSTTRDAYDKLAEGFGPGSNGPLQLVADLSEGEQPTHTLGRVRRAVEDTFGSPPCPSRGGTRPAIPPCSPWCRTAPRRTNVPPSSSSGCVRRCCRRPRRGVESRSTSAAPPPPLRTSPARSQRRCPCSSRWS
jgi:RND superfamily putative drug exporter